MRRTTPYIAVVGPDQYVAPTLLALDQLRESLRPDGVWGGDRNHALLGQESAGSMGGRRAVQATVDQLGLQVPTTALTHHLGELRSIDHIAVPGSWQVASSERVSAVSRERRLSDHDAYVTEVVPR